MSTGGYISLEKGQKIDLTKGSSHRRFYLGLSWNAPKLVGGHDYDCDVTAMIVGQDDKILDGDTSNFVFYGLAAYRGAPFQHNTGCILHTGDVEDGDKEGDDEVLIIDTSLIPAGAKQIDIFVSIHDSVDRGQNFGVISDARVHLCPADKNNNPITSDPALHHQYDLNEDYSSYTAIQVGSVYRNNGEWKFAAMGQGYKAELRDILGNYGVPVK